MYHNTSCIGVLNRTQFNLQSKQELLILGSSQSEIYENLNPSMALHKKEESVYLKKKIVFTSRGPLIVRTISWAVDFNV